METKPDVQPTTELTAEEAKESRKWTELELDFLNRWINRRGMKRWQAHLGTLQQEEKP